MSAQLLDIATAPRVEAKTWKRGRTTWDEVCAWAAEPRDGGKDGPCYVLGRLSSPRRTKETIVSRGVLTLDADHLTPATRDALLVRVRALGCAAVVHSTHGSTPQAPRLRLLVLASRPVTPEEYRRLVRWLMGQLGADLFDPSCAEPERCMYRPTRPAVGEYFYEVIAGEPWDVDLVLDLAGLSSASEGAQEPSASAATVPGPEAAASSDARAVPEDVVQGSVARTLAKLDALAALADGERLDWPGQADGVGWDRGVFFAAQRLVQAANSGASYTLADAERDFMAHAPAAEGTYDPAHKWREAVKTVGEDPLPYVPPASPADDFGDGAKRPAVPLAVRLRQAVEDRYDVFPAMDDGRIFAVPKDGGRAELVNGGFVIRATQGMGTSAGTLTASATEAAKVLTALAAHEEPRALALRVHQAPGRIVLDLAQPGRSACVVVTGEGWSVEAVPPPGVVFMESGRPLPTPERGGSVEELRQLLRWDAADPRWPLVKGWLPAALLAHAPRPMLGFFGPQGSAKTTTGRFVVGVLDPKPSGALGGGFGKARADDETKALKSYLPAWDNVSSLSGEGADFLSRLVTGDLIERRMLYSDADLVTIHYRRSGVITGVTVPRGVKPDTLDRFILVAVQPLTGERLSEAALDAEWARVHPRVLAGVLDLAVRMLAGLARARGQNTAGLRMADYAEALWAIDPSLYDAYAANVQSARADMAGEDPFIQTLLDWLTACGGTWEGTADQARKDAGRYQVDPGEQWWPRNGKTFSDEVTRTAELLRAVGITVTERRSNGRKLKRFTLDGGAK
jgi:hypothetical protein